jgi:phage terminase large subunit-like protein
MAAQLNRLPMMPAPVSPAYSLAQLPPAEQQTFLSSLTDSECERFLYDWRHFLARPNQLAPPGDWRTWLILAGRGFGKSRSGAEWTREQVETKKCRRLALVGRTASDVRDVMVEGESGILAISPPWFRPKYEPSKRRLTWPNGAIATTYSADEPDVLRGPQHDGAWADELASWKYPDAWDQLQFGLRLGDDPRVCVTTTPKPNKLMRELIASTTTAITRGSTYDNRANLAKAFFSQIIAKFEGTRLGRQELLAQVLEDVEGALWTHSLLELTRVKEPPAMKRIVIAVDPSIAEDGTGDACGLISAGRGQDDHGYTLEDGT